MKNFFRAIGVITLTCFGFIFTEKTVNVLSEQDVIMQSINEVIDIKRIGAIDAKIDGDTIVPGINGKTINRQKSYSEMKKIGIFDENYLVYDEEIPNISITKNYDKYIISGNKSKNMVSLVFLLNKDYNINQLLSILNRNDIKATFFISDEWLTRNNDTLELIHESDYDIGNLNNNDYTTSNYEWLNIIIKRVIGQKYGFCLAEEKDDNIINKCSINHDYTILSKNIIRNNYFTQTKKLVEPGSILVYEPSITLENELNLIVNYIKSKGLEITNLSTHLKE